MLMKLYILLFDESFLQNFDLEIPSKNLQSCLNQNLTPEIIGMYDLLSS